MKDKKKKKKKENISEPERIFDRVTGFSVPAYSTDEQFLVPLEQKKEEEIVIDKDEEEPVEVVRAESLNVMPEAANIEMEKAETKKALPFSRKPSDQPGTSVCIYFQVHQPFRLRNYNFNEIGKDHFYENYEQNLNILNKVADKCYLPANSNILELCMRYKGEFKVAYSISGVALEQFELYRPDVIKSFQALVNSGSVEMLEETYYHSLSYLFSPDEFDRQVRMHREKVRELFGVEPVVFRNTELIFNNDLANHIAKLGYKGMLCEGADKYLGSRLPNQVYAPPGIENFGLLLKNYRLSDDVAFRFSNHEWEHWPLTAEKFTQWIHDHAGGAETINLFMDYETFGEHQWKETGIFGFLDQLPEMILSHPDFYFRTPSEILEKYPKRDTYDVPETTSWADAERDLSAWNENEMQREALEKIYSLETGVKKTGNEDILKVWGKLQTSDHFYYMSTKFWSDGDVHKYFSPFESPYDACIYYMNVLTDLERTIADQLKES